MEIIIDILCIVVRVATLIIGALMNSLAKLPAEQQVLTAMKVFDVLGLLSAVFKGN